MSQRVRPYTNGLSLTVGAVRASAPAASRPLVPDELDALLDKVDEPELRAEIRRHIDKLRQRRSFGLVFESHLPERVRLADHPIRRGVRVVRRSDLGGVPLHVARVTKGIATVLSADGVTSSAPVEELVVVAEFGEPIFPGLERLGSIDRGGGKPAHVVINAENHHALEMLQYTHAGRVDAIYIDPPYNTGAKDWKYDNDYVDGDDAYRHSKWLAFMQRRLRLAKALLNPEKSVLIVTIDEKEYLRLGMLLEQEFNPSRSTDAAGTVMTMVTSSISAAGVTRKRRFARSAEYIYIVQIGESAVRPLALSTDWNPVHTKNKSKIRWNLLLRSGTNTSRSVSQIRFYPVFVADTDAGPVVHSVGEPFLGNDVGNVEPPDGTSAVWPIRADGTDGVWQVARETLLGLLEDGFVRLGEWRGSRTTVYYLKSGEAAKVRDGRMTVVGHRADGSIVTDESDYQTAFVPTDVWRIASHDAGNSGSRLLTTLIPGRRFPFPKSLYAVEDTLRFFVGENPNAVVLDFFVGSGTTVHAVARLNHQDGGCRQAIVVTNNEVSADESAALSQSGHFPGDPEWELQGVFEHITRPRITAAMTGLTPDGQPLTGDYKFVDEFPMADGFEENVEFLKLTYQDAMAVELNEAFTAVAPLLWLKAGGRGPMIEARVEPSGQLLAHASTEGYGVLFDPDAWRPFVDSLAPAVTTVFVVTDSLATFAGVAGQLPTGVEAVRLYESYLQTFSIGHN